MKLNDEQKFFVQKNLFENKTIQQFKPLDNIISSKPASSSSHTDEEINSKNNSSKENLISLNPLNSSASIKMLKDLSKGTESPMPKSLFDLSQNAKFKPAAQPKEEVKPVSAASLLWTGKAAPEAQPFSSAFPTGNPFASTMSFSNTGSLFNSGKSLF